MKNGGNICMSMSLKGWRNGEKDGGGVTCRRKSKRVIGDQLEDKRRDEWDWRIYGWF